MPLCKMDCGVKFPVPSPCNNKPFDAYNNLTPVGVDPHIDTYNIDPELIEEEIIKQFGQEYFTEEVVPMYLLIQIYM